MWLVRVIEPPEVEGFKAKYWPKEVQFKENAEALVKQFEQYGGKAEMIKIKNIGGLK